MQRIFIFLYFLLAMSPLTAIETNAKNDLRILELLPSLLCPLAVDPAIPANFVALSPQESINLYDWVFWGPEDVLKAYFDNPDSLSRPIIGVTLSANVTQTGPNSFSKDTIESLKMLKKQHPKKIYVTETRWGDYPVLAIKSKLEGTTVHMAWVGLNDPEGGWTLMFNLVYPGDKNKGPSRADLQLWENFITKTKQLQDGDFFKAYGQDLQVGYTLVNIGGAKLKMQAEKRARDGTIQVVVIPENTSVTFDYEDMMECPMGAEWKYGELMVKVYGAIKLKTENIDAVNYHVTSIFLKTVPEFTYNQEDQKELQIFQKSPEKGFVRLTAPTPRMLRSMTFR